MGIWEAMEMLNTLVDESDPDVSLRQYRPHVNAITDAVYWGTDQLVADRTSTSNR